MKAGDWVNIEGGASYGLIGRLVEFKKGLRVVVSVCLLHRSVCLEVDQQRLLPLVVRAGPRPKVFAPQHEDEVA
jgi:hypothetical protein